MKKLFLLIAAVTTLTAKSQTSVYHPFPEDTATWVSDFFYSACMGYCGTSFYEMKGDTLINSQSYNKLYGRDGRFYYITGPPNTVIGTDSFGACSYIGAIRQDINNKKVYFIDSTMTTDTLLYDFDLTVGDTIQSWYNKWSMPWPFIVTGIDSISINGAYHKNFILQNFPNSLNTNLIEGVGWPGELFGVHLIGSGLWITLTCFDGGGLSGGAVVGECSVSLNCSIALNINEQNQQKYFSLFPNPFSDQLNFTVNNNELSEIILYDIASRKLLHKKFTSAISLNTEQLAKGIYIYEVRNKNGVIKQGKVVKE